MSKSHSHSHRDLLFYTCQEIRNGQNDKATSNQLPSVSTTASLRDDEQRIQLDMIEMLTLKLAKKERENELLRVQQVCGLLAISRQGTCTCLA